MTRENIQAVVLKYLARAVPGLDPATVDTSKSMKDLNANSLDIVEIVSSTMRELRIKVAREKLRDLQNIDALVNLLRQTAEEKVQAQQS